MSNSPPTEPERRVTDPVRTLLAEIKAAEDDASAGPWIAEKSMYGVVANVRALESGAQVVYDRAGACDYPADAAFIAASRTWLPALREAVEAVLELHGKCLCEDTSEIGWHCAGDIDSWPCPTVVAITAALAPLLAETNREG